MESVAAPEHTGALAGQWRMDSTEQLSALELVEHKLVVAAAGQLSAALLVVVLPLAECISSGRLTCSSS